MKKEQTHYLGKIKVELELGGHQMVVYARSYLRARVLVWAWEKASYGGKGIIKDCWLTGEFS